MPDPMNDENCKPSLNVQAKGGDEPNPSKKRRAASTGTLEVFQQEGSDQMDWKQLFQSLRDERMTAAEEQLGAYVNGSQQVVKSLKSYSAYLSDQLRTAKEDLVKATTEKEQVQQNCATLDQRIQQLESSQQQSKRETSKLQTKIQSLESKLQRQERELWMYRKMTSSTLSNFDTPSADPNLVACDCSIANQANRASTTFRLASFYDEVDTKSLWFKYIPLVNPQLLPAFLHNNIEFDMNQLPSFLQAVLLSLFPEEEDEDDDEDDDEAAEAN